MLSSRITKRYASAFLDFSERNAITARTVEDAKLFLEVCHQNRDFALLLKSPVIKASKKKKIIRSVFENVFTPETLNFINMINDHQRENLLMEIFQHFIELYKDKNGILTAELITAVPTDQQLTDKIKNFIQQVTHSRSVELIQKINPDIIGGFKIRFKDKLIDATVSHDLFEISKRFNN